ncbi:MAG: phage holin family protein [Candidatus Omnitrophica bacterium]|nr:phage holin family protein [Candidatus Omnitrophota bacterium]
MGGIPNSSHSKSSHHDSSHHGSFLSTYIFSTDHKTIGIQYLLMSLFFLFFGLVMLALLIVIYSWESDRMLALGLLTGAFLSIGLILALLITQSLRKMPRLFEASITEFAKDREALSK